MLKYYFAAKCFFRKHCYQLSSLNLLPFDFFVFIMSFSIYEIRETLNPGSLKF